MRPIDPQILDLIGAIYDCAIDPGLWPAVLQRIAGLVNGSLAAISLHDANRHSVTVKSQWNVDSSFEKSMAEHFSINPLVPTVYFQDVDEPYTGVGSLGSEGYLNSRWHRLAVAPHGLGDSLMTLLAKRGGRFGALSLFREGQSSVFTPMDVATLKALAPHVRRAAMIADLLESRALERETMSSALDLISAAVVLTNDNGLIIHANKAAKEFLDDPTVFNGTDTLSVRDSVEASALRRAIASAGDRSGAEIARTGLSLSLRAANGRDLAVWVLPLDRGLRQELGNSLAASVAVFIRELGDTSAFPAELFVRRYGITAAECRLLVLLTQGMTVADAAETLGITIATARTHITRLHQKTATNNLPGLMRLSISALAPARM